MLVSGYGVSSVCGKWVWGFMFVKDVGKWVRGVNVIKGYFVNDIPILSFIFNLFLNSYPTL